MSDEAPQLAGVEGAHRFPRGHLEVVEVSRHVFAVCVALDRDVEQPGRSAVEAFLDRPHTPRPHDLHEPGVGKHLDVVGDGALRSLERGSQLADGGGALVQQVPYSSDVRDQYYPAGWRVEAAQL